MTKNIKQICITTYLIGVSLFSFAQSVAHSQIFQKTIHPVVTLPSLPNSFEEDTNAFQFAYPFATHISKSDIEPILQNDSLIYEVTIQSIGAYSLNCIFEDVDIPTGATITISSTKYDHIKTYTKEDIPTTGILPTVLIEGDEINITYTEPATYESESSWVITQVAHDYKDILKTSNQLKSASLDCQVDINCDEGQDWQVEKNAVCKLIIQGITACTGTLIGNTAKTDTPYLITANHCIASNYKASRTTFYFNYENSSCGTSSATKPKTLSGSTLIATSPNGKLDFALLQLSQVPPESYKPYYAGWNISETISKGVTCIHHPAGDVKKISIDNDKPTTATFKTTAMTYVTNGHWNIERWDTGTTEGGSSGSALFDKNHLIIGTLSGGEADCETPINDFFSKISMAWNYYSATSAQLQPWLDPINSGSTKCNGYDPYSFDESIATNVGQNDNLSLYDFDSKANGMWTGNNEMGWQEFAERIPTTKTIYDLTFCGNIDTAKAKDNLTFYIWEGKTEPETILYSAQFNEKMIYDTKYIYIRLNQPITPNDICWIGYKTNNNAFTSYACSVDEDGTFYVNHSKGWVNTEKLGFPSHLSIIAHVTNRIDTVQNPTFQTPFFSSHITDNTIHLATEELFGIDSLTNIKNSTQFFTLSDENVSNWSGTNEITSNCFANTIKTNTPSIVRGLKIAVSEIPSTAKSTDIVLWNEDFSKELSRKTVANTQLKKDYFNQIHFDTLVYIDSSFSYGICFDTTDYDKNISLYMYDDIESAVQGNFFAQNSWNTYQDYDLPYNVGLQPIVAKTKYHYNKDSANVLYSSLLTKTENSLDNQSSAILFPSICQDELYIQCKHKFYSWAIITLYNLRGEIAQQQYVTLTNGFLKISIYDLPQGTYGVTIKTEDKTYKGKVIHIK